MAFSESAASITALTSSIAVSSDCTSRTRSDEPCPALVEHQHPTVSGETLDVAVYAAGGLRSEVQSRSPAMPRMKTRSG